MEWNFLEYQTEALYKLNQYFDVDSAKLSDQQMYCLVLYFYLLNDVQGLRFWTDALVSNSQSQILKNTSVLRLQLRTHELPTSKNQISFLTTESYLSAEIFLQAEYLFVLGLFYEKKLDYLAMSQSFKKAYQLYSESDFQIKALKAFHNYATALSQLDCSPSYIQVYQDLYKKALSSQNLEIQRMALYNISVHFYKMKVYGEADKYIKMSLASFENLTLNRDYYLCVLQFCKIQYHLSRYENYKYQLEICLQSPFVEIANAANLIFADQIRKDNFQENVPNSFIKFQILKAELTPAEVRLVELLLNAEITKDQIIEQIYGHNLDYQSALNRLNNLLSRVRKKTEFKIDIINDKYVLTIPHIKVSGL